MRSATPNDVLALLGEGKLKFDELLKRLEERLEETVSYRETRTLVQKLRNEGALDGDRNLLVIWKTGVERAPVSVEPARPPVVSECELEYETEPEMAESTPKRERAAAEMSREEFLELEASLVERGIIKPVKRTSSRTTA